MLHPLANLLTEYSVKAMELKIERGDWQEGNVWKARARWRIDIDLVTAGRLNSPFRGRSLFLHVWLCSLSFSCQYSFKSFENAVRAAFRVLLSHLCCFCHGCFHAVPQELHEL
ncbi:MAG TPA: hypothetical protein VHW71_11735 [Steroidobacteraceae bacterium]|nr:hypothetical protein [Steroidobacteraceae bacterium]